MTTTFDHRSIGPIKAKVTSPQIVQFLGLQYATISDRFAKAAPKHYAKGTEVDATKLGPQVLTIPQGCDFEQTLVQRKLPYEPLTMSDIDGLNLNITVPAADGVVQPEAKLPVFVFIHGGGFNVGSNSWPQYDLSALVTLSQQKHKPVIGISINYRLGAPGLLTSRELRAAGYETNNALRDQRAALIWIRQYIGGFGGDGNNVTLMGESAGGVSATYHLHSEKPLFKRIMPMSGTSLLMKPVPEEAAEGFYAAAVKALGLEDVSAEERVKALLEMDGQELRGKLMAVPMLPVVDGDMCRGVPSFAKISQSGEVKDLPLPGKKWCEGMMIGDCQFDGSIQALRLQSRKRNIAKSFTDSINRSFASTPQIAQRLLSAYSLSSSTPDDEAFFRVLQVANDICFYGPNIAYAAGFSKTMPTYVYRFNEPNPWEGPWKGHATHILDIALLFQNSNHLLDAPQRELAEDFGGQFLAFVNGEAPWEAFRLEGGKVMVLAAQGGGLKDDRPEETGRRAVMLELAAEVGWDALSDAWDGFMNAPDGAAV